jgi:hypothetical protein
VDRGYERKNGGYTDTDNNFADFSLADPIAPINSAEMPTSKTATHIATGKATHTATSTPTATFTPSPTSTPCSGGYSSLSLVINEVGWMGTSATNPNDEWVELHNTTACPIPLSGWKFTIVDTNTDIPFDVTSTISAYGYFLLAANDSVFKNVTIDQVAPNLSFTNNGESLRLTSPTGVIDTANQSGGSWPAGIASDSNSNLAYSSMERYYPPGATTPPSDSPSAWVTYAGTLTGVALDRNGNHVHGTPRTANWASTVTETPTPCPGGYSSLSLVINEVGWMGTEANSNDEWVEFYNPTACSISLKDWTFTIVDTGTDIPLDEKQTIGAYGYFLLAENSDALKVNKVSIVDQVSTDLSLTNDGESLQLTSPSGALIDTANFWDGYWPAGIASNSNSNLAYSSMERYYPPGGTIPGDSLSAWVTFAGSTTNTPLDSGNNHVHGTPGYLNWASSVTETPSPTPTNTRAPTPTFAPTPVPAVVLNEILPRPGSDWNGDGLVDNNDEFIEVENLGPGIVDLTNWKLDVMPNNGIGSFILPSRKLNPNDRVAFFGSTTQLLLEDSGETVRLTSSTGVIQDAFTYPPALQPDDSWCRIRDGIGQWRDGCFPTPGLENTLSGIIPPLPSQPAGEIACQLPDSAPDEFRLAECSSFGAGIWNQQYWDELSGQNEYAVPDPKNKWGTFIQ